MADNLGEVKVIISGDNENLKKTVTESKQVVNEVGDSAVESGKKMSGGFDNAAKSATRLRSIVSKLFIPAAIFASVTRLIKMFTDLANHAQKTRDAMAGAFKDAEKQAMEFRRRGLTDLQKDLASLNDQFRETQEQLRKIYEEGANPRTFGGLVQTIWGSTKDYDEAVRRAKQIFDELKRAAQEANKQRMFDINTALSTEVALTDAAIAEMEADRLESQKRFDEAADKRHIAEMARYQAELEALQRLGEEYERQFGEDSPFIQARIEAEYELHRLRVKLIMDEAKMAADEYRKQMEDAIRRIQQTISGSLGGDFTNFGDAIAAAIDRNTTALQRRVRP
jgi:hypothetical protein